MLTARAALRADAGYVTLCVPEAALPAAEALALEPVKVGLPAEGALDVVLAAAERAGAVALGPGLGRDDAARALVRGLLERLELPVVVDADALFGLEPVERSAPTVLTPHAGELARLLGRSSDEVSAARLSAAAEAAERFGAVVLLKGADTIVAGARRRRARRRPRAAVARDGGDGRRPHRRRRRVPRQGDGAGARGRRRRVRARDRGLERSRRRRASSPRTSSRRCLASRRSS